MVVQREKQARVFKRLRGFSPDDIEDHCCYCHEFMVDAKPPDRPCTSTYSASCNCDTFEACPLQCLRAPEMAAGGHMKRYDKFQMDGQEELAEKSQQYLSIEE